MLVIHALTGSADAAGDWWAPLIGPGLALDTDARRVMCANLLGGRYGSTGPSRRIRTTGRPWSAAFPAVTARDEARALWVLADALGIEPLRARHGRLAGRDDRARGRPGAPGVRRSCRPDRRPGGHGPMAIAWNHIQLELVDRLGAEGLALARQLAMTTYRSEADFDGRFGRAARPTDGSRSTRYLDHQGDKLVERFDPDTYRTLVRGHGRPRRRPGARRDRARRCAALAASGTGLTGLGIQDDILYGPAQVQALVAGGRRGRRGRDLSRARYRPRATTRS